MKEKSRLMIIDGFNQFLRSYIVDPSVSASGHPIGGVKGFLKILNKLTREIKPDNIIIVWDGEGGSTKRRQINKSYKEGRKPPRLNRFHSTLTEEEERENKHWQHLKLLEILNSSPIIQFLEPGVEADDIIAFVTQSPFYREHQKVIVSSDKDFFQLLDEDTILYRPVQKEILNKNNIISQYGISPQNFALARAIAGDVSDNLPGIKGVGLASVAKRFPELSREKDVLVEDLIHLAAEKQEELKIYQRIFEGSSVIKSNYKVMQLYSPLLPVDSKERVLNTIRDFDPQFNKTSFVTLMAKEGFGEISLTDLYSTFKRISHNESRK